MAWLVWVLLLYQTPHFYKVFETPTFPSNWVESSKVLWKLYGCVWKNTKKQQNCISLVYKYKHLYQMVLPDCMVHDSPAEGRPCKYAVMKEMYRHIQAFFFL